MLPTGEVLQPAPFTEFQRAALGSFSGKQTYIRMGVIRHLSS